MDTCHHSRRNLDPATFELVSVCTQWANILLWWRYTRRNEKSDTKQPLKSITLLGNKRRWIGKRRNGWIKEQEENVRWVTDEKSRMGQLWWTWDVWIQWIQNEMRMSVIYNAGKGGQEGRERCSKSTKMLITIERQIWRRNMKLWGIYNQVSESVYIWMQTDRYNCYHRIMASGWPNAWSWKCKDIR